MGLKSIDLLPLVPQKLSVESSINDDVYQKSMFKVLTLGIALISKVMCKNRGKKNDGFLFSKFPLFYLTNKGNQSWKIQRTYIF